MLIHIHSLNLDLSLQFVSFSLKMFTFSSLSSFCLLAQLSVIASFCLLVRFCLLDMYCNLIIFHMLWLTFTQKVSSRYKLAFTLASFCQVFVSFTCHFSLVKFCSLSQPSLNKVSVQLLVRLTFTHWLPFVFYLDCSLFCVVKLCSLGFSA